MRAHACMQAMNFGIFLDDRTFTFPIHIHLLKTKFTPNMKNWTPLMLEVVDPVYLDKQLHKLGSPYWKGDKQVTEKKCTLPDPFSARTYRVCVTLRAEW